MRIGFGENRKLAVAVKKTVFNLNRHLLPFNTKRKNYATKNSNFKFRITKKDDFQPLNDKKRKKKSKKVVFYNDSQEKTKKNVAQSDAAFPRVNFIREN